MSDFEEIYSEYFSDVHKYVLSLCRNENIAEEVTQETFFKAIQHIDKFNGSCKLYVWLCQIAKNTYFSMCKKQKRIIWSRDTEQADSVINLENDYFDKDTAKRLHIHYTILMSPTRRFFTLRVFGELPFSQIENCLGNRYWARLIFYRAKKQYRRKMK